MKVVIPCVYWIVVDWFSKNSGDELAHSLDNAYVSYKYIWHTAAQIYSKISIFFIFWSYSYFHFISVISCNKICGMNNKKFIFIKLICFSCSLEADLFEIHVLIFFINGLLWHWGRDEIDNISQTTFSIVFSLMKMFQFWLKFHWSLFLRVQLTKSSIRSDNGLAPPRGQAIIWTNDG